MAENYLQSRSKELKRLQIRIVSTNVVTYSIKVNVTIQLDVCPSYT